MDASDEDDIGKVDRPSDLNIPAVLQDTQAFYDQTQGDTGTEDSPAASPLPR